MANKTIIHTDFNDNVNNNESQHVGIFGEAAKKYPHSSTHDIPLKTPKMQRKRKMVKDKSEDIIT